MKHVALLSFLMLVLALSPIVGQAQEGKKEKVYRGLPSQEFENILKDMKITYKKARADKEGIFLYDFERKTFKIRLTNYGTDLWVDAIFPKVDLKEINRWNKDAKFSRAVLFKDGERESTSLENQLDCRGGVTFGMVRQFIRRFDDEVQAFGKFLPAKGNRE